MPDIKQIIKHMIDAGEDESSIAAVIRHHESLNHPDLSPEIPPAKWTGSNAGVISDREPDTFWGGVGKSLSDGSAFSAGARGFGGYLKGAIANIPSTVGTMINDFAESVSDPERIIREIPGAVTEGIPALGNQMWNITKQAGSNPEAFGEMMGELTGQPAIMAGAGAGVGAINRSAPVRLIKAGITEPVGRVLEGTRAIPGAPISTRGAISRVASKTISPIGKRLRQYGENQRLAARGVETPTDLAAAGSSEAAIRARALGRPPVAAAEANPYTEIFNRQAMRQGEADPIPPIVEDPNTAAARGTWSERAPIDTPTRNRSMPYEPSGVAPVETADELARRGLFSRANPFEPYAPTDVDPIFQGPVVETPDSLAARGGGTEPAYPFEPTEPVDIDPIFRSKPKPEAKTEPAKGAFKPGNDPKSVAPKPTSDTAPPPLKSKNVKWNNPFGRFNNETGAVGRDISPIIEAQARERLARATNPNTYDLGDISQPIDLNQSIQDLFTPASSAATTIPTSPIKAAPKGVNPLRPIVPEGQVTNRRMFELSDQIGAQNKTPAQQFAEEVLGGHEFNPDMLFTPEEQVRTPIPETPSPVENQFDPRITPGGVISESTPSSIKPEDWGDWGGAEKDLPELIQDADGSTVAKPTEPKSFLQRFKDMWEDETGAVGKDISDVQAKNKVGAGDRKWSIAHPSGKPIGDIEVTKAELAAARKAGGVPDDMDNADLSNALFQQKLENIAKENGYSVNDLTRLRIQYNTKAAKEGSVEVKPKAPTAKSTPIGPQGKSYRVTDDNDNHLGDVTITPDEVQEAIQAAEKEGVDLSPDDAHQILYEDKVENLLESHGRKAEDISKTSGKIMNANQKKVRSTADTPEPNFSTNKTERPEIDPEKAWAQGGNTKPLIAEAERLARTDGPDTKFSRLLPKNLRFPLGEGETYRGRLNFLIEATKDTSVSEDASVAARLKERDDFLASIRQAAGVESLPDVKPLRNQDIGPPLRIKDLILTREGKINKRK